MDHCLASYLQKYLAKGQTSIGLLQPASPLGPYSARRLLCYSLGLIGKSLGDDLETIGAIRNKFAHNFFDITFKDEVIVRLCNNLSALGLFDWFGQPVGPRHRFTISVIAVANRLLLRALGTKHRTKIVDADLTNPIEKPVEEREST